MANIKISELNSISEINTNDIIPIVDISADETKKISMGNILDLFYPVGSYYETSNTTFDPNTSWGGTWVEDTAGRVTVALDENDTDFNVIDKKTGVKQHRHLNSMGFDANGGFFGLLENRNPIYGSEVVANAEMVQVVGTYSSSSPVRVTYTTPDTSVQPSVVVKRWHRTA